MNLFDSWIDGGVYHFMTRQEVRDEAALDTPILRDTPASCRRGRGWPHA